MVIQKGKLDLTKIEPAVKAQIAKQAIEKKKKLVPRRFVIVLAFVSILGFVGIVAKTLFESDITSYIESLWLLVLAVGLIVEADLKSLKNIKQSGLNSDKFSKLVTVIIGFLALIVSIFSLPVINWVTSGLLAIKGVVSLVAIVFIIIQTWIVNN